MTKHPSKETDKDPFDIGTKIKKLEDQWGNTLETFTSVREEMKGGDVFDKINYLTYCDQICKEIYADFVELDSHLKRLNALKEKHKQDRIALEFIDNLQPEIEQLLQKMQKKLEAINEEYPELSEETLRVTQDLIDKFANSIMDPNTPPSLTAEIRQSLEKDLFLQEIRDSLEMYREAREDYVNDEVVTTFRMPDDLIPEDFGEEFPEIDPILSQIDTAITSCDMALLSKDIEE